MSVVRRMPYGSTTPYSSHLIPLVSNSVSTSGSTSGSGGNGGTAQTSYEIITPYFTEDSELILEQAGDNYPGYEAFFDKGFHLFDGREDTYWKVYDSNTQNGYGTLVIDLQFATTITQMSFVNQQDISVGYPADTIEVYVSNSPTVPIATSTKIIDLTGQLTIPRTGLVDIPTASQTSARYLRVKVSHPYGNFTLFQQYGLVTMKIYGYPFVETVKISPLLTADNGKMTASGPVNEGQLWHVFDGTQTWAEATSTSPHQNGIRLQGANGVASLTYDFTTAKTITKMHFWNYQQYNVNNIWLAGTGSLIVEVSNDNSTFTQVASSSGKDTALDWWTYVTNPTSARYVKITLTRVSTATINYVGIQEIEIYGI